ncbi:hypothetical protein BT69DRAFT_1280282 [Atractiella rhizophila]|nr:hypothetical protein BT69DRAFT_1280282 [Atractiella rhizophila]
MLDAQYDASRVSATLVFLPPPYLAIPHSMPPRFTLISPIPPLLEHLSLKLKIDVFSAEETSSFVPPSNQYITPSPSSLFRFRAMKLDIPFSQNIQPYYMLTVGHLS